MIFTKQPSRGQNKRWKVVLGSKFDKLLFSNTTAYVVTDDIFMADNFFFHDHATMLDAISNATKLADKLNNEGLPKSQILTRKKGNNVTDIIQFVLSNNDPKKVSRSKPKLTIISKQG